MRTAAPVAAGGLSVARPAVRLAILVALWLGWTGAAGAAPAPVPAQPADLELAGTLTGADHQTYQRVPFTVPAGTERLVVSFAYDHRDDRTVVDLGIEDPSGLRGASGGNKAEFTLAATDATPSYLPGPIVPGEWHLALAVPNIRPGVTSHWQARLWFLRGRAAQVLPAPTEGRGPGWYRGDLHLHTAHSDGSCASQSGRRVPCPLLRTLATAAARGLDFVAVTDHNTASQAQALREAQPYFDRLLLIPGREITTFYGHFNVLGITAPLDFRIGPQGPVTFNALAGQVHALGGLVSINHPALPSGEQCMGCGWTMPAVDYARVDAVEAINGGSQADVPGPLRERVSGVPFWLDRLLAGQPVTAVGGSDNHDPDRSGPGGIGSPVTVVHAADLSQAAILDGIRAGRVFVALDPAATPLRLDFRVVAGAESAMMGGALVVRRRQRLIVVPDVAAPAGASLALLDGTRQIETVPAGTALSPLHLAPGPHALRLTLRSAGGALLALGNAVRITVR